MSASKLSAAGSPASPSLAGSVGNRTARVAAENSHAPGTGRPGALTFEERQAIKAAIDLERRRREKVEQVKHGTTGSYDRGCHCPECRRAHSDARRARKRRKAQRDAQTQEMWRIHNADRGMFTGRCYVCGVQCGHTYCSEHRFAAEQLDVPFRKDGEA